MGRGIGVLAGIANPAIADVPGAFARGSERGRDNETRRIVGEILGSTMGGKLGALGKVNAPAAIQLAGQLKFDDDPKKQVNEFVGTVQLATAVGNSVGPRESLAILVESRNRIKALVDRGMLGPGATSTLDGMIQKFNDDPTQGIEALNLMNEALREQGFGESPTDDKSVAENRKEIRKSVRTQTSGLRKEEGVITTNFKKIRALGDEIDKGNRSAVSQALVALVKIGDPTSVVRPSEAAAALNNPTVLAALFTDAGTDQSLVDAAIRAIDPLNPGVLRKADILSTADAMVLASVPGIQARFADAKAEAENLPSATFKTLFSGRLSDRINKLSDLVKPSAAGVTDTQIAELKAARPDLTEQQIKDALK